MESQVSRSNAQRANHSFLEKKSLNMKHHHCVKCVRIYSVFFRIQSEYGKIRTRKTPNTDTFHTVHERELA